MNIDDSTRTVPPVSWDNASIQQILDYLNPNESEEDVYRAVDEFGEWAASLDEHHRQHAAHWAQVSVGSAGKTHTAAADFGAATRAALAAGVADLGLVQSSMEKLIAHFVEVRRRVERLNDEVRSAREPLLDWVLTRDDEPNELTRRDKTEWAQGLMRQYERAANDELSKWPPTQTHASATLPAAGLGEAATVPIRNANYQGDDTPTKPTRVDGRPTHRSSPAETTATSGAAMPTPRAFGGDDFDLEHRSAVPMPDERLFGSDADVAPPVIGADSEFDKDEDSSW